LIQRLSQPLIRLLKAWKYNAAAPVSSFYLEMRAAEYAAREGVIIFDIDLVRVMNVIVAAKARSMNDPAHIVGRIPACASGRSVGAPLCCWAALSATFASPSSGPQVLNLGLPSMNLSASRKAIDDIAKLDSVGDLDVRLTVVM